MGKRHLKSIYYNILKGVVGRSFDPTHQRPHWPIGAIGTFPKLRSIARKRPKFRPALYLHIDGIRFESEVNGGVRVSGYEAVDRRLRISDFSCV